MGDRWMKGLPIAARHDIRVISEVGIVMSWMDRKEHFLACIMGELGQVAILANKHIVFVGAEV